VRESSATWTVGGGQVLQPVAHKIRRRHLETLERIERLWIGDVRERGLTVAWFGGFAGFTVADLVRGAAIAPQEAEALIQQLQAEGALVEVSLGSGRKRLLHRDMVEELEGRLLQALDRLHEQFPLMSTHDRQKVQAQLDYVGDEPLVHAVVDRLLSGKKLVGDLRRLGRADFKPRLSANLRKLKDKLIAAYSGAGFAPPEPSSFANQAGGNAANLRDLFDVCVAEGHLARITDEIYLHIDVETEMRRRVTERLQQGAGLTVADIRDLLGTTRKYAVPLCEYLDRVAVTRREGDLRFLAGQPPVESVAGGGN
jgi:selenocysteine-specific elongation factor